MTQGTARHINALTGLRILAAGAVFLSHVTPHQLLPDPLKTFMASGYNGVTLFFVLSGFVLMWSYGERLNVRRIGSLWSFFVARFARIYPLYLFALLVAIAPLIVKGEWNPLMLLHASTFQTWSTHLGRAFAYNGPGWSIGVEVFLYACFPLLLVGLARVRKSAPTLLMLGALIVAGIFLLAWWFIASGRSDLPWTEAGSDHRWLYRTPLTRLGDFAVGCIAALLVRYHRAPRGIAITAQVAGAASMVLLMCNDSLLFTAWSWDAAFLIPAALLMWGLAAGPHTILSRLLSTRPMVLLGQASFAFYLLHYPLIWKIIAPVTSFNAWIVGTIFQFVLIVLIAVGAHIVIERPAQKWLRRTLDRKRTPPSPIDEVEPARGRLPA